MLNDEIIKNFRQMKANAMRDIGAMEKAMEYCQDKAEIARRVGIKPDTLRKRLQRGCSIKEAVCDL